VGHGRPGVEYEKISKERGFGSVISKEDAEFWTTEIHKAMAPLIPSEVKLADYDRWIEYSVPTPRGELIKRRAQVGNTPERAALVAQLLGIRKFLRKEESVEFAPWEPPRESI